MGVLLLLVAYKKEYFAPPVVVEVCPMKPDLRELGGRARWRVETSRRIFIKWRLRGRFLKLPTPPTVDRRGVPVGLSILLLIMFLCVFSCLLYTSPSPRD